MRLTEVIEQYLIDCENWGQVAGPIGLYCRWLGLLACWLVFQGVRSWR
jgi:hypothetical protein